MWNRLQDEWAIMWKAGSIMWARAKVVVGLVWTAVTQSGVDLSTIVSSPKWLLAIKVGAALLLADGLVSEAVRRHGATDLTE